MPSSPIQIEGLLVELERHEVAFMVVGGVAAVLQGAPIATFDLDVLIDTQPANLERLLEMLVSVRARYRDPGGRLIEPNQARLASQRMHLLSTDLGPLDILTELAGGLRYEALVEQSPPREIHGRRVRVLGLQALIASKEAAGRPKDLAVLPTLRALVSRDQKRTQGKPSA
jgi:hypothetical protein